MSNAGAMLVRTKKAKERHHFSLSICQGQTLLIIHFWFFRQTCIKTIFNPKFFGGAARLRESVINSDWQVFKFHR